jgi:hypothetical protein
MKTVTLLLLLAATQVALFSSGKNPLTNGDVVKMIKADLPESTIIIAIQNSPSVFDATPDALIELKGSGVGSKVIEAMLTPRSPASPVPATPPPAAPTNGANSPAAQMQPIVPPRLASLWGTKQTRIEADRVFLLDGEKRVEMKFTKPSTRSRVIYARQTFAVLGGTASRSRTPNRSPAFEMIFPNNVEPTSVVALANLGIRSNGTREILISSGWISMTEGLPADRNVKLTYEKKPDQSEAPEGYEIYKVRSEQPLKPGEYAFMVSKPSAGEFGPMGGAGHNFYFYELGVD